MIIIKNSFIPFKGYKAINLLGIIWVRKDVSMNDVDYNHEAIHTAQIIELGFIFFYLLYCLEWFFRSFQKGDSYYSISFEREAYANEKDLKYLYTRKRFAWIRYWKFNNVSQS